MPRVSVIVPVYNAAHTIGRALESALVQTETSLEVVVIDDASTDTTASVVAQYAGRDPRVRLMSTGINAGPGGARNRAIAAAQGTWIALLDADDSYERNRLEVLLALAEQHNADLVSDNILLCPDTGEEAPAPMLPPDVWPAPKLMTAAEFVLGNVGSRRAPRVSYGFMQPMMRRDFLSKNAIRYDERNRFGEDYMLSLECLRAGGSWWVTPEPLYHYAVRTGSLTEIQTPGDLLRISRFEEELLGDRDLVTADPEFARALIRHKAKIDRCYYYRAFTDAVKAYNLRKAAGLLFETASGFRHIMTESLNQMPVIAAKAARGGYFRRRSAQRAV